MFEHGSLSFGIDDSKFFEIHVHETCSICVGARTLFGNMVKNMVNSNLVILLPRPSFRLVPHCSVSQKCQARCCTNFKWGRGEGGLSSGRHQTNMEKTSQKAEQLGTL